MLMAEAAKYRRLRAPQEDGQALVEPPRELLPRVVAANRQQLAGLDLDIQGRPLRDLAATARRTLVDKAICYTRQYRDVDFAEAAVRNPSLPMILSGHQPQLFHPGVWYKNFVLGQLAQEVGGIGIHLLIDSDLCRTASIRVPAGSLADPRLESVEFDGPAAEIPYEERFVEDERAFAGFPEHVAEFLRPFVPHPILDELWPLALERRQNVQNLGLRIAQGRHALEARWGNNTLELPQSCICQMPEFCWFVSHIFAHLPRFWTAYNDGLAAYRLANRLRNRAHPVPDLAESDGWLEAPFWMWTKADPRRRPVFARQQGNEIQVTDRNQHSVTLSLSADRDASTATEQLIAMAGRGIKLRTRALATTLFARLLASDLFLHGIGGAKYDQVTDHIGQQFFGFPLPEFATASATLLLPVKHRAAAPNELRRVSRELRELDYHPERFLSRDGAPSANNAADAAKVAAEKRRWIETPLTPENARTRHLAISSANAALQPFVLPQRQQLRNERDAIERRLCDDAILNSREFAFCLFPRDQLRRLLDGYVQTP
jgi:hypothetical protein